MVDFVLNAKARDDKGKGASRRLRRLANQVPAIIYGGKTDPASISLLHFDVEHALENEAFYSHIITINVEGAGSEEVIVKDVQRHPSKAAILHMDFLRVDRTQKLHTKVPLHFVNEEKSVALRQAVSFSTLSPSLTLNVCHRIFQNSSKWMSSNSNWANPCIFPISHCRQA
jgi:large subunit ribosomal protein L25